jgi:uncharacterized membrane protein
MTDRRLRGAVLLLSLLGAGIAAYLTFAHFAHVRVSCATGGCETVQNSRYAEVAGVPLAVIGLAGYLVLAWTAVARGALARAAGFAAALTGFAVAMVLLYVQAGVLHAFCQWCLASDAILILLLLPTGLRAWRGAPPGAGSSRPARRRSARARARPGVRARPHRSVG